MRLKGRERKVEVEVPGIVDDCRGSRAQLP
jgi:hypothetical protein